MDQRVVEGELRVRVVPAPDRSTRRPAARRAPHRCRLQRAARPPKCAPITPPHSTSAWPGWSADRCAPRWPPAPWQARSTQRHPRDRHSPHARRPAPRAGPARRTICSAKNGFPAARSAMTAAKALTEGSDPSSSPSIVVVSESSSGVRAIVCAPCIRVRPLRRIGARGDQHHQLGLRDHP